MRLAKELYLIDVLMIKSIINFIKNNDPDPL